MTWTRVGAPQAVAVPQVAVQPRRRLVGDEVAQPADDRLDRRRVLRRDRVAVAGELEVGQHPAHGVELGPRRAGPVGHREAADEAVLLRAVRRRAGGVSGRERLAEARSRPRARASASARPRSGSRTRRRPRAPAGTGTPPSTSASQRSPAASASKKPGGAWGSVFISAIVPLDSRSRVAVAMSPPATGAVDTTAAPRSSSARRATSGWRVIRRECPSGPGAAGRRRSRHSCAPPSTAPPRIRRYHRSTGRVPPHPDRPDRSPGRVRTALVRSRRRRRLARSIARTTSWRLEPAGVVLLRAVRRGVVALADQRRRGARVHRLADVPAAGAGAADLDLLGEPGPVEVVGEHHVRPSGSGRCCPGRPARSGRDRRSAGRGSRSITRRPPPRRPPSSPG